MSEQLRIARSFMPDELGNLYRDPARLANYRNQFGDEPRWTWGAVQALKFIGDETTSVVLPLVPKFDEFMDDHSLFENFIDYFATLHALTQFKLRWKYPAAGLAIAMRKDYEDSDPTINLIKQVWGVESRVIDYAAWAANRGNPFFGEVTPLSEKQLQTLKQYLHALGKFNEFNIFEQTVITMFGEDSDTFHLTGHLDENWSHFDDSTNSYELTEVADSIHDVRIKNGQGWYGVFKKVESDNKNLVNCDLNIIIETFGILGTFRKSPVTNEWYSGSHQSHLIGN